tara:strand:+ start:5101 stop:5706 length:606 start_codon:yes stop_codon:yes gene_type:complete
MASFFAVNQKHTTALYKDHKNKRSLIVLATNMPLICITLFALTMVWALVSDVRAYLLSNRLCLTVAALYPLYIMSLWFNNAAPGGTDLLITLFIALIIFAVGVVLFARGIMGGGDVKLLPVVALWAGPTFVLPFLFITSIIGGLVTLFVLAQYGLKRSNFLKSSPDVNLPSPNMAEIQVPYGVGIAAGGLFVAWQLSQPWI